MTAGLLGAATNSACSADDVGEWSLEEDDVEFRAANARFHWHARGNPAGFTALNLTTGFFDVAVGASQTQLRNALESWVVTNQAELEFNAGLTVNNIALAPSLIPIYYFNNTRIFKLQQTYRGFPIGEASSVVSVVVRGTKAVAVTGEIIDQRINYPGLGIEGVHYIYPPQAAIALDDTFYEASPVYMM